MADINTNQAAASAKEYEPTEQEKALAKTWNDRLKEAKTKQKEMCRNGENLEKFRQYVNGKQHDDGSPGLVRTNLIFSTIATVLPYVYAKNPDISVRPTEAVEEGQYEAIKKFGRTLEIVLRRCMVVEGKLKKRAKATVRSTMTTSIGWLKVLYQEDKKTDPLIVNRIADIQDNLQRVDYLTAAVERGEAADVEAMKAELAQQVNALQAKVEVTVAEGFAIDRVQTEDMLVLDPSIKDFDMYPQARALAHGLWFTKEMYQETFGHAAPASVTVYKQPTSNEKAKTDGAQSWVRVWEIWDRISQTIYTMAEGANGFCRPPYQPTRLGERWYPFFALAFNPLDGQFEPLSDVELLKELQDEYNTTRTNFADHRKENLPGMVVRKGGQLSDTDVNKIVNRKINEVVVVEGDPGRPIADDLFNIVGAPIDPQVYDVSQIRNDMDLVAGISDASRSNLIQAKTATEAEIMKEGLMSRTSERQDTIEDMLQEMAQYCAEVLLQVLTPQQVQRIAGVGASWPQLTKDQIFDLVSIEIRAGSTGKPNKSQERQQWIEFMPTFQEMVGKIVELRAAGHIDMASGMIEMLKETLRRFDERLDLDVFIPGGSKNNDQQQFAQQLADAQQKLAALTQENATLKQAADQNATKVSIENTRIGADRQTKQEQAGIEQDKIASTERVAINEANVKAGLQERLKQQELDANAEIERERIASNERIEFAKCICQHLGAQQAQPADDANAQPVETNQSEQLQAVLATVCKVVDEFRASMGQMAQAMTADRVPVRDVAGRIVRMKAEINGRN